MVHFSLKGQNYIKRAILKGLLELSYWKLCVENLVWIHPIQFHAVPSITYIFRFMAKIVLEVRNSRQIIFRYKNKRQTLVLRGVQKILSTSGLISSHQLNYLQWIVYWLAVMKLGISKWAGVKCRIFWKIQRRLECTIIWCIPIKYIVS